MSTAIATKDDVHDVIAQNKEQIAAFGVRRLGLFGSFLHEQQADDSDVDLLVEFQPRKKTFDNFMGLAGFLETLLGRKVELVTSESLSPYIGPRILAEVEYVSISNCDQIAPTPRGGPADSQRTETG
jgi:hypothetical protein